MQQFELLVTHPSQKHSLEDDLAFVRVHINTLLQILFDRYD